MSQPLTIIGFATIIIGIILILLGFIMLTRTGGENRRWDRSYAVFLIGPVPIILKGGKTLAIILIAIFLFLTLLLIMLIRGGA